MNRWNIPSWLENEVKKRDKTCVYCGIEMLDQILPHVSRRSAATWEHIINDAGIVTRENIARCCVACNSSKGTKDLSVWIQSSYCRKRGINEDTVAEVVRNALKKARDKLTHNDGMPPTPYRPQSITASCGELGMPSATIQIFLVHGDPKRLRTAELSN